MALSLSFFLFLARISLQAKLTGKWQYHHAHVFRSDLDKKEAC